ncbi:MAG: hypothetical protein UY07_C0021G0020 [Parcubacteria group bacterium GW2011_GWA1_47_8]|nr:MAG: hypothetical protein UY07_C0021G0020 [Parcubacteria group bacterium GW2011_GWA1_47_8]KKW08045.1 MAG: hypothetical protein UY42_C0001G0008 [Parcubacteria group bacterium GW2011_GWA2_49_16]
MRARYILILTVLFVAGSALIVLGVNRSNTNTEPIACTMEAKICPDGSAVGRTGPKCEFAECPEALTPPAPVPTSGDVMLGIGEEGTVGDLRITFSTFVQDSRCPTDVVCIQAGRVVAGVILSTAANSETKNMSSDDAPYLFDGHRVSIASVTPSPVSTKKIAEGEYRVAFHVAVAENASGNKNTGTIKGLVTLSPTCPVERMPPEPQCAPKPYQTEVKVFDVKGSKIIKSTRTGSDGSFAVTLPVGNYKIQAGTENRLPSCSPIVVTLPAETILVDISCDTGIR